jgi:hypothetical protein
MSFISKEDELVNANSFLGELVIIDDHSSISSMYTQIPIFALHSGMIAPVFEFITEADPLDFSNLKKLRYLYIFSTFFNLENSEAGLFLNLVNLVEGSLYSSIPTPTPLNAFLDRSEKLIWKLSSFGLSFFLNSRNKLCADGRARVIDLGLTIFQFPILPPPAHPPARPPARPLCFFTTFKN